MSKIAIQLFKLNERWSKGILQDGQSMKQNHGLVRFNLFLFLFDLSGSKIERLLLLKKRIPAVKSCYEK